MTEQLKPLVSTANLGEPQQLSQFEIAALNASKDGSILFSELQPSFLSLLSALASDAQISENDPLVQLAETTPALQQFITSLQQSIADVKSATVQGQLLKQQLNDQVITQEQYVAAIQSIEVAAPTILAAISPTLPGALQSLIFSISNDADLKKLKQKLSSTATIVPAETSEINKGVNNGVVAGLPVTAKNGDYKAGSVLPKTAKPNTPVKNFLTQLLEIAQKNLQTSAAALLSLGNQPKIVSGARAVVKINGKVSALCTNVSCDISMNWQEIRGVDELVPNDLSPTEYTVKGSMTLYRVPNRSPIASYLTPDMFRSLIWPYSTIEIKDKRTDEVLLLVKRCAITSRTEQFNPRQLTTTVLTFVGIGMRDEEAPQLIPTPLPSSVSGGGLLGAIGSLGSSIAGVFGGGAGGGSGASGNDGG
jgi:hypothetical protein